MANRIRKGDRVIVIAGSNKGQIGTVSAVAGDRIYVDGVNAMVKHVRARGGEQGRLETVIGSIHVSNVAHIDENNKPIRVSFLIKNGSKVLVHRKDHTKEIRKT